MSDKLSCASCGAISAGHTFCVGCELNGKAHKYIGAQSAQAEIQKLRAERDRLRAHLYAIIETLELDANPCRPRDAAALARAALDGGEG